MENLDLITQLQDFYDSAWEKIIIVIIVLTGFVSVVIPIVFQLFQNRVLKLQKQEIFTELKGKFFDFKNEIKEEVRIEYQGELKELQDNFAESSWKIKALPYHFESTYEIERENYLGSFKSSSSGLVCYFRGKDKDGFKALTNNLVNIILPKITKEKYDKYSKNEDFDFNKYIDQMEEEDEERLFSVEINELKKATAKFKY